MGEFLKIIFTLQSIALNSFNKIQRSRPDVNNIIFTLRRYQQILEILHVITDPVIKIKGKKSKQN